MVRFKSMQKKQKQLPRYSSRSPRNLTNNNGGRRLIGGVQYMYTSFNTSLSQEITSRNSISVRPARAEELNNCIEQMT